MSLSVPYDRDSRVVLSNLEQPESWNNWNLDWDWWYVFLESIKVLLFFQMVSHSRSWNVHFLSRFLHCCLIFAVHDLAFYELPLFCTPLQCAFLIHFRISCTFRKCLLDKWFIEIPGFAGVLWACRLFDTLLWESLWIIFRWQIDLCECCRSQTSPHQVLRNHNIMVLCPPPVFNSCKYITFLIRCVGWVVYSKRSPEKCMHQGTWFTPSSSNLIFMSRLLDPTSR